MSNTITIKFQSKTNSSKPEVNAQVDVNDYTYTINKTNQAFGDSYIASSAFIVNVGAGNATVKILSPNKEYTLDKNGGQTTFPDNSDVAKWGIVAKRG